MNQERQFISDLMKSERELYALEKKSLAPNFDQLLLLMNAPDISDFELALSTILERANTPGQLESFTNMLESLTLLHPKSLENLKPNANSKHPLKKRLDGTSLSDAEWKFVLKLRQFLDVYITFAIVLNQGNWAVGIILAEGDDEFTPRAITTPKQLGSNWMLALYTKNHEMAIATLRTIWKEILQTKSEAQHEETVEFNTEFINE